MYKSFVSLGRYILRTYFHGHFKSTEVAIFQLLSADFNGERSTSNSLIFFELIEMALLFKHSYNVFCFVFVQLENQRGKHCLIILKYL